MFDYNQLILNGFSAEVRRLLCNLELEGLRLTAKVALALQGRTAEISGVHLVSRRTLRSLRARVWLVRVEDFLGRLAAKSSAADLGWYAAVIGRRQPESATHD